MGSEPQLLPKGSKPEILDVSSSPGGSTYISGFRIWNLPQSLLKSPLKESRYPVKFPAGWEMAYLPAKERSVWSLKLQSRAGTAFASSSSEGSHTVLPLNSKAKSRSGLLHSSQRAFKVEVSVPTWRCRGNPE